MDSPQETPYAPGGKDEFFANELECTSPPVESTLPRTRFTAAGFLVNRYVAVVHVKMAQQQSK